MEKKRKTPDERPYFALLRVVRAGHRRSEDTVRAHVHTFLAECLHLLVLESQVPRKIVNLLLTITN